MKIGILAEDRFEADGVLTTAMLLMLHPQADLVYTADPEAAWACDFVYHRAQYIIPPADRDPKLLVSFEQAWVRFGEQIEGVDTLPKLGPVLFRSETLEGITRLAPSILMILEAFNPTWDEIDRTPFKAFSEAIIFAGQLLKRLITSAQANQSLTRYVETQIARDPKAQILVLEHHCPWWEQIVRAKMPGVWYVVIKNGGWSIFPRDCWLAHGMIGSEADAFPTEWDGKEGAQLSVLSGVPDAMLAQNARRIVGAKSRDGALKLAELALHAANSSK